MSACTVTIFGKPLADLPPADANYIRFHLAELDWCADCKAFRLHQAAVAIDGGAAQLFRRSVFAIEVVR